MGGANLASRPRPRAKHGGAGSHLLVAGGSEATGPLPYLHVRAGLNARITRPVFYALADFACQHRIDGQECLGVFSGGAFFPLECTG